ncbi:MAG: sigma-70 family RNA polymerase sigma factor [Streptosporangiaceae bacterium]|jgi:RNA polymerase sigma-70 factor (ECF subfamily)
MTDTAVESGFLPRAESYRRELFAHCYRMLGSVHDAEDLVQETYLRAWRAYDRFEGRSSLRTWLYRIATSACLTALESRGRRPMPTGLGAPAADPDAELAEQAEVPWLEPVPDALVTAGPGDPAAIAAGRESIRLAFIAALQHLPPRQRAVLILREVLNWRAAEVADLLGTSTAAVNSMLQRARAQLSQAGLTEESVTEPVSPQQRQLLERYMAAFERYDIPALVKLFTADAVWEMPPFPGWYHGAEAIGRLVAAQCPAKRPGDLRMLATGANGQPGYGMYLRDGTGRYQPFQLQAVHLRAGAIDHVAAFFDPSLFPLFGLPAALPAQAAPAGPPPADPPGADPRR